MPQVRHDDAPSGAIRRFGSFEWDRRSRELRKRGLHLRLARQPMEILDVLVENADRIVTRDELRRKLWQDDTFVDFEQGLNTAVNKLRQTLGDSAERPRFVETVPGQGYRFIARVERPRISPAPVAGGRVVSRRTALVWGLSLGAAAAAGYFAPRPRRSGVPTEFRIYPPPGYWLESAATREGFALSPDGRRLAFTAKGRDGRFHAWRRDLDSVALHPIPHADGAQTVFWDPDGASLLSLSRGTIRRGPPDDGPYERIAETPDWLISGAIVGDSLLVHGNRLRTFRIAGVGSLPEPLVQPFPWPAPLPGRSSLLFLDGVPPNGVNVIRTGRLPDVAGNAATIGPEPIAETNSKVRYAPSVREPGQGYLMYVRAGTLMAHAFDPQSRRVTREPVALANGVAHVAAPGAADFAVSGNVLAYQPFMGRSQLNWVDRSGRSLGTVGPSNAGIFHARLSPDGRRIALELYDVERGGPRLWILDAEDGRGDPRDLFAFTSLWAPDSTRIAFAGLGDGESGLRLPKVYIKSAVDDSVGESLAAGAPADELQNPVDWSRDERFVFYRTPFDGNVGVVDLARGGRVTPLLSGPTFESDAVLSPDGRWLAFVSNRTGRPEAWVQSFESDPEPRLRGEAFPVSENGALVVRWNPSGSELFYAGADGTICTSIVSSQTGRPERPEALFEIEVDAVIPHAVPFSFDVHPDGSRLLVPRVTNPERDHLVVIQNWEALVAV